MLIAYALASAGMDVTEIWFRAPVTVAYFTVLAMLLFECRIWLSSAWGHAALIVGLPIVYVAVPAIAGNGATMVATVIFGWERMLAAYSFFREHRDQGDAPYREALFFLTVDPSIVWPDRAKRDPDGRRDLAQVGDRVALGSVQLASQTLVLLLLVPGPGQPSDLLTDVTDAKSYFQFVVAHLIVFASVFLAHAGLANVQIGFVELAGMRVGERYRRPYVSTSPRDFWRRWNVWVANWARRYVYQPVVRFIDGRSRWKSRRRGRAVAVFVTFVVMGLLHDVAYAATFPRTSVPLPGLIVFLLFGVLTLSWHVVTPRVQVHGPASRLAALRANVAETPTAS